MYESISKNNELENEMTLDMSFFWYSDTPVRANHYYHDSMVPSVSSQPKVPSQYTQTRAPQPRRQNHKFLHLLQPWSLY